MELLNHMMSQAARPEDVAATLGLVLGAYILPVAVGGFLGGVIRFGFSRLIPGRYGTFAANIVACAIFGLTMGLSHSGHQVWAVFATTGLAGGMSTWSTLAAECGELVRAKKYWTLTKYLGLTVAAGIIVAWRGAMWAGY